MVIDQKTYQKILPPITRATKETDIQVKVDIRAVTQVNELQSQFIAEVAIHLKWKDPRITFKNLNGEGNFLDNEWKSAIWLPPLKFSNTFGNEPLITDSVSVQALREGNATIKPDEALNEGERYSGAENSLVLFGQYQHHFYCPFDLTEFPFDSQHCSIDIRVPLDLRQYINLLPWNLSFSGLKKLHQFHVTDPIFDISDNATMMKVVFTMHRIPSYLIQTAYVPSLCIIIMSILALYGDENQKNAAITLVLTSLLCLYTLFQNVLADVTKTAYLKYMDYWYIFSLGILFVIFLTLVGWELASKTQGRRIKKWSKLGIPLVAAIFVTCYWIQALWLYDAL